MEHAPAESPQRHAPARRLENQPPHKKPEAKAAGRVEETGSLAHANRVDEAASGGTHHQQVAGVGVATGDAGGQVG